MRLIIAAFCLFAATVATAATRTTADIRYGADGEHRLDVYWDDARSGAPVIVMLHGGGWKRGSKKMPSVWKDKVAWWLPRGYVFVSVETRLLPEATPDEQAQDFAKAVAFVQANAAKWGGDPSRVVLMGHSAGAHVAALVASDADLRRSHGVKPVRGVVPLDSAALDVESIMRRRHPSLYDNAFGDDPTYWVAVSPLRQVASDAPPVLAVCSTNRRSVCSEARTYAKGAARKGVPVTVLPVAMSHGEINSTLGKPSAYTEAVSDWIADKVR